MATALSPVHTMLWVDVLWGRDAAAVGAQMSSSYSCSSSAGSARAGHARVLPEALPVCLREELRSQLFVWKAPRATYISWRAQKQRNCRVQQCWRQSSFHGLAWALSVHNQDESRFSFLGPCWWQCCSLAAEPCCAHSTSPVLLLQAELCTGVHRGAVLGSLKSSCI